MTHRRLLLAAAVLGGAGFALAAVLARQHPQAYAGVASFCTINDFVNCDRVATSRYSVVLGLPVAVWGMLGYGLAGLLALAGLRDRKVTRTWPVGLLLVVAGTAAAVAVVLALVSELAIGALCLLCAGSWAISLALFAVAWRATRPQGIRAAVRADLAVLRDRPALTAGVALAGAAAVALIAAAYPRYWEAGASAAGPAPGGDPAAVSTSAGGEARTQGPAVVVEFSDYECPFCAQAHEETKALLASRPDVVLVRRHFPLDSACNPGVSRRMHPRACDLARAAICAEEQGKLPEMDDALFRNQREKLPVEEVAAGVGLDLERFRKCLSSAATEERLRSDVQAGIRIGLQATPTYVVGGRLFPGKLPVHLLPPAR